MSIRYEDALETLRRRLSPQQPDFVSVMTALDRGAAGRSCLRHRLAAMASSLAMMGFVAVAILGWAEAAALNLPWLSVLFFGPVLATLLPAVLLVVAARFVLVQAFAPQMLARAVWWSNLVVGALMAHLFGSGSMRLAGALAAVGCASALLIAGRRGLDEQVLARDGTSFRPVAYRGLLTTALIMAFADGLTLAFSGLLALGFGQLGWSWSVALVRAGPPLLCALIMAVAVWGLLRLRTWALVLNLLANFAIAWLALYGVLGLSSEVSLMLAVTAGVQALLPTPIIARALGDRPARRPWVLGQGHRAVGGVVILLAVLAGWGVFDLSDRRSTWLHGGAAWAFQRGL